MAENHPAKTQESRESDLDSDTAAPTTEVLETGSFDELSDANPEDTAERLSLQEQESGSPENNDADSYYPRYNPRKSKNEGKPKLGTDLLEFQADLNELLRWKERLTLRTIEHDLSSAYYDLWTKEANLFFRRLVIIKKRIETVKKQKRA